MLPNGAVSSETAEIWRRRALAHEAALDLPAALEAYQRALDLSPSSLDIAGNLASLAFQLGDWEMAEKLYVHLITNGRQDIATLTAYAASLREQARFAEAADLLKTVLGQHPGEATLWEGLGTVMAAQGDLDNALTFFNEALRLAPDNLHALFNRGCALLDKGDLHAGLDDLRICANGFKDADNMASAQLTCAHAALALGDLEHGWRWYEGRHKHGTTREVIYDLNIPLRKPSQSIAGKRLFISAEQGLGDEILYASLLPEVMAEIHDGAVGIGIEPRLVALFQRSFPKACVVAHHTQTRDGRLHRCFAELDQGAFDAWALMGDFLASRRAHIDDFPERRSFLTPDSKRVAYWQAYFAGLNGLPKVGLLWKSLKASPLRDRSFSPFTLWQEVLATPGIQFINLQYGDASVELAEARAAGIDFHTPAGIDLKADLDDLAALTTALDLVLGPSNATSNIAAACGVPVWILSPPKPWLALGRDDYPWYPSARMFTASTFNDWQPALQSIRSALVSHFNISE